MARVPTAANVGQVGRARANPDTGARRVAAKLDLDSGIGAGLEELGGQVADIFADMREQALNEGRIGALNEAATTLPLRFEEALEGLKTEAQPGAAGFAEQAQKTFEETRQAFLSDLGRRYDLRDSDFKKIEQQTQRLALPNLSNAFRFEQTERRRFFAENLGQQIEALALSTRREPTPGRIDLSLSQALAAIENGADILTPEQLATMRDAARRSIHTNALEGAIEIDPGTMLKRLEAGDFDALTKQGLAATDIERLTDEARVEHRRVEAERERARKEQQALLKGRVASGLKDDIASIRRTGESAGQVSDDQIRAAYSDEPGRAEAILQELKEEEAFYATRQSIALTPLSEDLAILNENRPAGEGFAVEADRQDLLAAAVKEKRKALASDPAGYLFQVSPGIAEAFQAAEDGPDIRAAVDTMLQEQERLGVPRFGRKALSNGQAGQMTAEFAGQQDAQGRADWVRAQAEIYGDHWPRVYGELVQAGLPPGARVQAGLTGPGQTRVAQALAEAQDAGQKELKAALGNDIAGKVEDAVRDNLLEFTESLSKVSGGASTANLYSREITTLAMSYVRQGADAASAAERAATDVVNSQYNFRGTFRVPVTEDIDKVDASSEDFIVTRLPKLPVFADPSLDPRLPEDERRRQYIRAIQDKGYWVTNGDETGLLLMDEQGRTVLLNDGEPVELLWGEMLLRPEDLTLAPAGADSP